MKAISDSITKVGAILLVVGIFISFQDYNFGKIYLTGTLIYTFGASLGVTRVIFLKPQIYKLAVVLLILSYLIITRTSEDTGFVIMIIWGVVMGVLVNLVISKKE